MGKRNGNVNALGVKANTNNNLASSSVKKESDDGQDPGMADYLRKK